MAGNKQPRPKAQKFSIRTQQGTKARVRKTTQGIEGIDRSGIDDLAEQRRVTRAMADPWDD